MQYDFVNIEDNPVSKLQRYFGLQRADGIGGSSGPDIAGNIVGKSLFLILKFLKLIVLAFLPPNSNLPDK